MPRRPNILIFVADGMQRRTVEAGNPCRTPAIDSLIARGVSLRGYTPLPTCSPARASLMTGLLPHNHGMLTVEHTVAPDQSVLRRDKPHFAQSLRAAGYRTGYFGKWHIERTLDLGFYGWDTDHSASGKAHRSSSEKGMTAEAPVDPAFSRWQRGPDGYNDTLHYGVVDTPLEERPFTGTTRLADAFVRQPHDAPWCAFVTYFEPNEAMIATRAYADQYDWRALPLPPNRHDPLTGRPNLYRRGQALWADVSDDQWRQALACYYARCSEIDAQLGRLLATLEETGQLDNTVVLVSADHGKYVGAHGLEAHNYGAFEEIYGVPLVAAGPGIAARGPVAARAGLQDLCPTILELAGLPAWELPDSRSFAPLLRDPDGHAAAYQGGFAEYHGTRFPLCQRIVWDGPWKYVFNGFDFDELYNLDDDPWELTNLAAEPAHATTLRRLAARMWERILATGDSTLANTHYYSLRLAPVGPNAAG